MGTDRYAYQSKLRLIDPIPKFWFSISILLVCLFCESIVVSIATVVIMSAVTMKMGGQNFKTIKKFMAMPITFLVIGCLTIVIRPIDIEADAIFSFKLFGKWLWGISPEYVEMGLMVFFKAMGTISAMYFLSLNTPMTDIVMALERLHIPSLFIELMELIYRFIFVLTEQANNIRQAQDSRLGYYGFHRGINSLGVLGSMVFLRALRRGDKVWSSLESRGYTGSLKTLPQIYKTGKKMYLYAVIIIAVQISILAVERRFF